MWSAVWTVSSVISSCSPVVSLTSTVASAVLLNPDINPRASAATISDTATSSIIATKGVAAFVFFVGEFIV